MHVEVSFLCLKCQINEVERQERDGTTQNLDPYHLSSAGTGTGIKTIYMVVGMSKSRENKPDQERPEATACCSP